MNDLENLWVQPSAGSTFAFVLVAIGVLLAFLSGVRFAATHADDSSSGRTTVLAVLGVGTWVAATGMYVATGWIAVSTPAFMAFFLGSNLMAIAVAFSPLGTLLANHLPLAALAGFQVFRLPLEMVLHSWSDQGSLPRQMTFEGHNLDIVTGIVAFVVLVIAIVRKRDIPRSIALAFNVLGSGLLLGVIVVVMLSSPLPIKSYPGPPILLGFYLPYAWIAPVCVGGAMCGHLVLWRRLLGRAPRVRDRT